MVRLFSGRRLAGLFLLVVLFGTFRQPLGAVPTERMRIRLVLSDGTQVEATRMGDEHFSYYLTDDGETVVHDSTGYRVVRDNAELRVLFGQADVRRHAVRRRVGSASAAALTQHGSPRVPVVLVSFADKDFMVGADAESVRQYYHLYCNGTDDGVSYTGHGSKGSLREYFMEQSSGDFSPEFTAIGPVKLDSTYAYYGANSADGNRKDVNYAKFCAEAVTKATASGVDWTRYDNDGDGAVDLVMFVFAGVGESNSFDADAIWPKELDGAGTIGGVRFAANSSVCESRLKSEGNGQYTVIPDGVGVFIHELSHALGLPDFYDTRGTCFGMDYWSVMDYGEYADNGFTPVAYTAYERDFMGWQPLRTVSAPATLHLASFASGGCGWKVVSDFNPDEYYILENRQADGWDVKMCSSRGHGLMVTHVDYSAAAWTGNTVNTQPSHQRMTIIPANNSLVGSNNFTSMNEWVESLRGNLWPGTSDNHELTDNTTPASVLFTGKYMSKPIVDIQEDAQGRVTLKFMPRGILGGASGLTVQDRGEQEATLCWEPVSGAQCYNLRVQDGLDEVMALDSIEGCTCRVSGLNPDHVYTFTVQPLADDYLNGEWAVPASFSTLPTGISDMNESERLVRVFATDGLFVTECRADEVGRLALRAGIYLLRYPDFSVRKMYIR